MIDSSQVSSALTLAIPVTAPRIRRQPSFEISSLLKPYQEQYVLYPTKNTITSPARSAGSYDPFSPSNREAPARAPASAFVSDQPAAAGVGGPRIPGSMSGPRPSQGPASLLPLQHMISVSFPPFLFMHDFPVFRVRLRKHAPRRGAPVWSRTGLLPARRTRRRPLRESCKVQLEVSNGSRAEQRAARPPSETMQIPHYSKGDWQPAAELPWP